MKKLFAILAVAGLMTACKNSTKTTSTEVNQDSLKMAQTADSIKNAMQNVGDSANKMMNEMADSTKSKMNQTTDTLTTSH